MIRKVLAGVGGTLLLVGLVIGLAIPLHSGGAACGVTFVPKDVGLFGDSGSCDTVRSVGLLLAVPALIAGAAALIAALALAPKTPRLEATA